VETYNLYRTLVGLWSCPLLGYVDVCLCLFFAVTVAGMLGYIKGSCGNPFSISTGCFMLRPLSRLCKQRYLSYFCCFSVAFATFLGFFVCYRLSEAHFATINGLKSGSLLVVPNSAEFRRTVESLCSSWIK
jgi:hypothetical protein